MSAGDAQIVLNPGAGGAAMRVRTVPGLGDQEVVTLADGDGNLLSPGAPSARDHQNEQTAALAANPSMSPATGHITVGSTAITTTAAFFTPAMNGLGFSDTLGYVPAGATITFVDSTHATLSAAAVQSTTNAATSSTIDQFVSALAPPAAAVFTGQWTKVSESQNLLLFWLSITQPQAAYIEWSADGITQDPSAFGQTSIPVAFSTGFYFFINYTQSSAYIQPYYRVVIINGPVAQIPPTNGPPYGQLALNILSNSPFTGSFANLTSALTNFSTALLVRAVAAGVDPNGNFNNLPSGGKAFSSATPLAANAVFTSAVFSRVGYVAYTLAIESDQQSAFQGIQVNHCTDAAGANIVAVDKFTFDANSVGNGSLFATGSPQADYLFVTYTNGSTIQTTFNIEMRLEITATEPAARMLAAPALLSDQGTIAKSSLMAQSPALVSFINGATVDVNGTSFNVPVPAGTLSGMVMLTGVTIRGQVTITPPPGNAWKLVISTQGAAQGGQTQAIYQRVAGGSEPASYPWSWSGAAAAASGACVTASNASTVTPIFGASGQANGNQTAITSPGVGIEPGSLTFGFFGITNTSAITAPTNWTQATQDNTNTSLQTAYLAFPGTGISPAVSATAGSSHANIGQLVTLQPFVQIQNLSQSGSGNLLVEDRYAGGQTLVDQTSAGPVLTFTFAQPMSLIWVYANGQDSRADAFGGVPSANQGIVCPNQVPTPITVRSSIVSVSAPSGTVVSCWGYRY